MPAADTLARLPATRAGLAVAPGAGLRAVVGQGRRWLATLSRGFAVELIVLAIASASIALMVVLAGGALDRPAPYAPMLIASPPLDPVTGVDIRDGVVANGMVTPYMERVNGTPDP